MTRRWTLSSLVVLWVAIAFWAVATRGAAADCLHRQAPFATLTSKKAVKLLISQPKPEYPPAAQVNYIHGRVRLLVTVGCRGRVETIHVEAGHPFLAQASIDSVRRWVYHPYLDGFGPAPFQTRVDVKFNLRTSIRRHFPSRPDLDLLRVVRPPKLISVLSLPPVVDSPRLRLLVSSHGRVIDSTLIDGTVEEFQKAAAMVTKWKFMPARCDNLDVPWYVEMVVPLPGPARKAGGSGNESLEQGSRPGPCPSGVNLGL